MDNFPVFPSSTAGPTTGSFRLILARGVPSGTRPAGRIMTSRTSGAPIEVFQKNGVDLWWVPSSLRGLRWCNRPSGPTAHGNAEYAQIIASRV